MAMNLGEAIGCVDIEYKRAIEQSHSYAWDCLNARKEEDKIRLEILSKTFNAKADALLYAIQTLKSINSLEVG